MMGNAGFIRGPLVIFTRFKDPTNSERLHMRARDSLAGDRFGTPEYKTAPRKKLATKLRIVSGAQYRRVF